MTEDTKKPDCWLVGIRIDPDSDGQPDLYTVMVNDDRPLVSGQSIVMFRDSTLTARALSRDDDEKVRQIGQIDTEPEYIYDVATAMHLISSANIDPNGTIVQCLNFLFDLLSATNFSFPSNQKGLLQEFADHLTFNKEYGLYLEGEAGKRESIVNTVLLGIGWTATHTTIFQ